ncbi:MAG: porphobilinogen synthase [Thermoplasmata archaeon]
MRLRRLRKSAEVRKVFSESEMRTGKLIMPLFIDENISKPVEIKNMPNIFRFPLNDVTAKVKEYEDIGIKTILLFGVPDHKDSTGSASYDRNGIIQKAVREIKKETDLVVFTDLCLCEYTDHGHCGIVKGKKIDNDSTLEIYGKIAKSYAEAGVDGVAPSGMMDGQVGRIRKDLDSEGFEDTLILAYSAKFASSMYSPFREAVFSVPSFGDRRTYQMPYNNAREAIREMELDIEEGADSIMVKPALFYLDLIREARNRFLLPIAAYSVSAEYSMIMSAAKNGIIDLDAVVDESISSIFRAGADIVISYFTEYILKREGS